VTLLEPYREDTESRENLLSGGSEEYVSSLFGFGSATEVPNHFNLHKAPRCMPRRPPQRVCVCESLPVKLDALPKPRRTHSATVPTAPPTVTVLCVPLQEYGSSL